MKHRAIFLAAVFIGSTKMAFGTEDARVERLFGGPHATEVVASAERVELTALTIDWDAPQQKNGLVYHAGEFRKIEHIPAKAISTLLLSTRTYDWAKRANDIIADYHIRMRFSRADDTVEVDLSFYSDTLKVRTITSSHVETFSTGSDALFDEFLRLLKDDEHMEKLIELRQRWKAQRNRPNTEQRY